ncbi:MAG: phenylalanine--tRNA ligase subunit beta [Deltaproteobacteria bacterium]|nr:MAG: phenylalanine--tRNA ligase subunit beta [Deltaproteobacteria bacterium]
MKVSRAWLAEYIEGPLPPPDDLAERLTFLGLEVEAIERPGDAYEKRVVVEVRQCSPHPQADALRVCEVFDGTELIQVVCGAPNVREGGHYVLARPGAVLPDGTTLASAEIRGVPSHGMLLSPRELGLGDDHSGLLEVGEGVAPGTTAAHFLGVDDVVFVLGVTPNRPDALSHIGVARDLAAALELPLRLPGTDVEEAGGPVEEAATLRLEDAVRCPRYSARVVESIAVRPSPPWLAARLLACGVRAINNVVDVTNYVLLELGQPLHAFDLDRVEESTVVVRRAREGETLRTLDEVERRLDPDDLVIADASRPIALAGVMGGANSEVHSETRRVLIESAYFEPTGIRHTARRHGLHTEASHRFERGADPEITAIAASRAAALLAEFAGGTVRAGVLDAYPTPIPTPTPRLRWERTTQVLGLAIPPARQKAILGRLGFEVVEEDAEGVRVRAPSFRTEMEREIDLIEEVARVYGLEHVPATLPRLSVEEGTLPAERAAAALERDRRDEVVRRLHLAARAAGLLEVVNYSFLSPEEVEATLAPAKAGAPGSEAAPLELPWDRPIRIANPLSAEQSVMRTLLLQSLLSNLRRNLRAGVEDLGLYEIGRDYLPGPDGIAMEHERIGGVLMGRRCLGGWNVAERQVEYWDAKGIVEALLAAVGLDAPQVTWALAGAARPWLHPRSGTLVAVEGRPVGWLGEVHPLVRERFDLPREVVAFELDLDALVAVARLLPEYRGVPRFPPVLRDLAVVVDEAVPAGMVAALLREPTKEAARLGARVAEVRLFDVYRGEQIGPGKKSLAFAVRYQADDRTLTDAEAAALHQALVARLASELGAELRR